MGLKKFKSNLKSLPYTNEGTLGEPYITIPIDESQRTEAEQLYVDTAKFSSYDKPIRGGAFSLVSDATDVLRIGKFLIDFPRGPLFLLSQEGLQLSNPKLEPQHGIDIKDPNQDTRLYNFGINTLAQVGVSSLGIHFMRHGLFPEKSISVYEDLVNKGNGLDEFETQILNLGNPNIFGGNRLLDLYGKNILNDEGKFGSNDNLVLYKYLGGPNSTLGIGETVLNRYTNTTTHFRIKDGRIFDDKYNFEINYSSILGLSEIYQLKLNELGIDLRDKNEINGIDINNPTVLPIHLNLNSEYIDQQITNGDSNYSSILGLSEIYQLKPNELGIDLRDKNEINGIDINNPTVLPIHLNLNSEYIDQQITNGDSNYLVFTKDLILKQDPILNNAGKQIQDFRKTLVDNNIGKGVLAFSDYTDVNTNIETRIRKGNPGKIGVNRSNYGKGTGDIMTRDLINMIPLYSSTAPLLSSYTRDLIKFRFKALNNDKEGEFIFIHFRAYLSGISDNFSGDWDSYKYNGRGEKFYTYQGFDRKITFSFKIHPQSREEMKPLYQKLNFLISNTAPDYNINGFMRGPLVQLNIGDYISDQTGFISSIGITIPDGGTWEIALHQPENAEDNEMQELPKYIEVNIQFTPIHNFVPRKGVNIPFITDIDKKPINNFLSGDIIANNEAEIMDNINLNGENINNLNSSFTNSSSDNSLNSTIDSFAESPSPKRNRNNSFDLDGKAFSG
jgi:hypothetical protein